MTSISELILSLKIFFYYTPILKLGINSCTYPFYWNQKNQGIFKDKTWRICLTYYFFRVKKLKLINKEMF